jgi:sugar lactone lactonase YvrE
MQVGCLVPRRSGGLALATPHGIEAYDPDSGDRELLVTIDADDDNTRMNDGKCDRRGRFWVGTMAFDPAVGLGRFYRVDPDFTVTTIAEGVTVSNGLAWNADDTRLYYVDSRTHRVDVFDFDLPTGEATNRRPFVEIPREVGTPDGMCIDIDDHIWVALYRGGGVHRYTPYGELDRIIEVPASQVTCCAFGGPRLDELYITTAAQHFTDDDRRREPAAGSLYRTRPGVIGPPVNEFAG